ncbi:hypothetical protein M885DRAFT_464371 [Pelagophyceae sp. CCMP2097]|nr:hypothetical protein M885DRAFT_464371 [Pelagophyceae sp. CCMP2097]
MADAAPPARLSEEEVERVLSTPKADCRAALRDLVYYVQQARESGDDDDIDAEEFVRLVVDEGVRCVDVRSPGEFSKGRVLGASSCPLFDDEERALVGTCFKRQGREAAMILGMARILRRHGGLDALAEDSLRGQRTICVHCWRGGFRSGSVAWLLRRRGAKVYCLKGGYKAFRGWVRSRWGESPPTKPPADARKAAAALADAIPRWPPPAEARQPRIVIVGGRTGVGKTRVLHALAQRGAQVLDLEGVAVHRGSSFGWKAEQPSNEAFENTLALKWRAFSTDAPVFVEDEEGHVGACLVPPALYSRMAAAKLVVRVNSPIEARVGVLLDEYAHDAAVDELAFRKRIEDATRRLLRRLGADRVSEIVGHVHDGRYADVARLLLSYYDKLYDAHLAKRDGMDATVVDVFVVGDVLDADATASAVLAEVARFYDPGTAGGALRRDDGGPRRPRLHLLLALALAAALALRLLRR